MLPEPHVVTDILVEVSEAEILPRFRSLERHEVQEKESGDLVTVADVAAEQAIARRLLDLLPGSAVVGEEAVEADPGLLDALQGDAPVWLIDPVDGTGNFAAGRPVFVVMIALVRAGETVAAWIHDPVGRQTAVAQQGGGAWLDGTRLQVARDLPLEAQQGTLHAGQFSAPDFAAHIRARRDRLNTIASLRCAGHEYLRLADGRIHFSLFTKLMPWDHAPGVLLHREAGGVGRTLDGARYSPARRGGRALLLAADEACWRALHGVLFAGSDFASPLA